MVQLWLLTALLGLTPVTSQESLSVSNGYSAAVVQADTGAMTALLPHAYAERSAGHPTPDLAYDLYGGLSVDGGPGVWLGQETVESIGYVPETGVARVVHRVSDLMVESHIFAPWELHAPAVALVLRVTNEGEETRTVTLATLSNLHLGSLDGQPHESGEVLERIDATHFKESGQGGAWAASYRVSPTPTTWSGTETNPFLFFQQVGDLPFSDPAMGAGDDRVLGIARGPLPLDPGESVGMTLVVGLEPASPLGVPLADVAPTVDLWLGSRTPDEVLADEIDGWQARLASDTHVPQSADELAVWRQGLALTLMAQVREPADGSAHPTGQILASLPPGMWNRTWPRDMSYAVTALARTGFADRALDGLAFILSGTAGGYIDEVGADYLVSITRYYGDGSEESDGNPEVEGPNIEFDGFGLFLWSLGAWADGQEDLEALQDHWPTIQTKVIDVILGLVEPETGLLRPDSSIWEVHWNGREKHFTYTNAAAVAGLCAAGRIAERLGQEGAAESYREAAQGIRDAVIEHLVDPVSGGVMGNLEEMEVAQALDAAAVEVINWGLIDADSPLADATIAALDPLRIAPDRGYFRNDDGGWYDRQEWVFVNLRIATALRKMGRASEADGLVAWVVAQTRANYDMIAELYTEEGAAYAGAVPMAGYGAGALALARLESSPEMDAQGCITWQQLLEPPDDPDESEPRERDGGSPSRAEEPPDGSVGEVSTDSVELTVPAESSPRSSTSGCDAGARLQPLTGMICALLLLLIVRLRRGPRARAVAGRPCSEPRTR